MRKVLFTALVCCVLSVGCGSASSSSNSPEATTAVTDTTEATTAEVATESQVDTDTTATSEGSTAAEEDMDEVTSGPVYDAAQAICPGVYIMANEDSITYDFSDVLKDTDSLMFSWYAARLLPDNTYKRVSFIYFGEDGSSSMISVSDFNKLGDFKSNMLLSVNDTWKTDYESIFGAHDLDYLSQKGIKDVAEENNIGTDSLKDFQVRNDEGLWFFSSFAPGSKKNFEEDKFTYVEIYDYKNTEEDGRKVGELAYKAIQNYSDIINSDASLLPKREVIINVVDVLKLQFTLDEKNQWNGIYEGDAPEFLKGYNEAAEYSKQNDN